MTEDKKIHIIPSGSIHTLCGKYIYPNKNNKERLSGISLGFGCNCQDCLNEASKELRK